ncbi:MAG: ATP-binding protein [Bacteroidales bacterium]|nr:ATP-binding protein [Bacteroidales bacterium]
MLGNNPFLIYGYNGPEFFCDRIEETRNLISALENGRNVTLMSPRRMGKTGLINNVFYHVKKDNPEVKCFYLDIFSTNILKDFTQILAQTVLGQLDNLSEKILNRMTDFFKSFRPVITSDPLSGTPTVSLTMVNDTVETSLKEIFAYIAQSGKECIIAIDEFQQITEYPEKGTEALLRSYIQFLPNVRFIFSGSKRHIMSDMFSLPNRPFYQSTQKMNLSSIDKDAYYKFAQLHLAAKGITITAEVFDYIYQLLYEHTWYIQRILNKIFEVGSGPITVDDINAIIDSVVNEEEYNFQKQYAILTKNQQNLLRAVAAETSVKSINGKDFIQKHQLGAASSVNRALSFLTENEFILDTPDGYQIYDRFMAHWLRRQI